MDDPNSDREQLYRTLRQFRFVNRFLTRSRTVLRRYVLDDAEDRGLSEFRFLDIGAGGCEVGIWLAEEAARRGMVARVACLDKDPRVVDFARERLEEYARLAGNGEDVARLVDLIEEDARNLEELGTYDYVYANHFLHHLPDEAIVKLLPRIRRRAITRFVLNDLLRSRLSYFAFTLLAAFALRGSFAFHDGRLSIRRGFRPEELEGLVDRAGLSEDVETAALFPGRLVLVGSGGAYGLGAVGDAP